MKEKVNIVWFKRDLRIHDNAPLHEAARVGLPIIPVSYTHLRAHET